MEMKQIMEQLEGQLKKEKLEAEELEKKVSSMKALLENAEKVLGEKRDNIMSLEMMIEAGKEGHFGLKEQKTEAVVAKVEEVKPVKAEDRPAKTIRPVKQPEFKHKNACVVQINEHDNIRDRWRTQKACARALGWDQSSVSKFMKLDKNAQIARKGFALMWEY